MFIFVVTESIFVEKSFDYDKAPLYLRGKGVHTGWERINVSCAESWKKNLFISLTEKWYTFVCIFDCNYNIKRI